MNSMKELILKETEIKKKRRRTFEELYKEHCDMLKAKMDYRKPFIDPLMYDGKTPLINLIDKRLDSELRDEEDDCDAPLGDEPPCIDESKLIG